MASFSIHLSINKLKTEPEMSIIPIIRSQV